MLSLFRTLSLRYLWHHWARTGLVVASIALGVAAWIATIALYGAVTRSLHQAASPLRGSADFSVTSPTGVVDAALGPQLEKLVPGIKRVEPLIIENIHVEAGGRPADAILIGLQVPEKQDDHDPLKQRDLEIIDLDVELFQLLRLKERYVHPVLEFRLLRHFVQPSLIQPGVLQPFVAPG